MDDKAWAEAFFDALTEWKAMNEADDDFDREVEMQAARVEVRRKIRAGEPVSYNELAATCEHKRLAKLLQRLGYVQDVYRYAWRKEK